MFNRSAKKPSLNAEKTVSDVAKEAVKTDYEIGKELEFKDEIKQASKNALGGAKIVPKKPLRKKQ